MGEDGGAYVASVHHYSLLASHGSLHGCERLADTAYGGHGRHALGHLEGADFVLDILAVQHCVLGAVGVDAEVDVYLAEALDEGICVRLEVGAYEAVAHGPEGDGAVHCARVYIAVADGGGQVARHGAFS